MKKMKIDLKQIIAKKFKDISLLPPMAI